MGVEIRSFSENVAEQHIIKHITDLNHEDEITGIMIQMPLPKHLNAGCLINAMDYRKDVEGIHNYNLGKLIGGEQGVAPSTPKAVMALLRENKVPVTGRKVTIIGRSVIVGTPLTILMSRENATVTLCHSRTRNLNRETSAGDIVVTAVGKPGFITPDMVTDKTVIIDAGINVDASGRICGDVHEETCSRARLVSAVPGGVGVITVAALFDNLKILHQQKGS
nr:bifunctional 5,10-methylenetetrahydrofolate dehydrogenase/5,10-methenyltetrahydrofolate cyclohydrolase [Syntrophomonas palmitatica]